VLSYLLALQFKSGHKEQSYVLTRATTTYSTHHYGAGEAVRRSGPLARLLPSVRQDTDA
jgi:hypothetical protein